ncbi:MAG: hypothetical protein DRN71_04325 [Candidatus Nanohalarchaeota archaeon]|nr:MAG: hypothetical protein DRN71_04325 [Candidatus Nanohaloarchaeota archaeon]
MADPQFMMNLGNSSANGGVTQANAVPLAFPAPGARRKSSGSSIGTDFVYMPTETVEEWRNLAEEAAELTDKIKEKYGIEATEARMYMLDADISAYDAVDPFDKGFFKDWTDGRKDFKDALQKLGGNTPVLTWAYEMLPVRKTQRAIENFWMHATKPRKDDYWPYVEAPEKYTPTTIPGGGMIWDAEQYWGFIKYLKKNYTEQFVTQMNSIKDIPDEKIRDEMTEGMERLKGFYFGLVREAAIPFAASSLDELYKRADKIAQLNKVGKLSRGTASTPAEIVSYDTEVDNLPKYDTNSMQKKPSLMES